MGLLEGRGQGRGRGSLWDFDRRLCGSQMSESPCLAKFSTVFMLLALIIDNIFKKTDNNQGNI